MGHAANSWMTRPWLFLATAVALVTAACGEGEPPLQTRDAELVRDASNVRSLTHKRAGRAARLDAGRDAGRRPTELLVRFREGVASTRFSTLAIRHGGTLVRRLRTPIPGSPIGRSSVVALPPGTELKRALRRFRDDPEVSWAEPNHHVYPLEIPNDARFGEQWSLDNAGQKPGRGPLPPRLDADLDWPEAMDALATTGADRETILVAILDTGVDYQHPELTTRVWTNPGEIPRNQIDDDGNGYVDDVRGYDFVRRGWNVMDQDGHGTHVAGIVGAIARNGAGIAGVATDVELLPVRVLGPDGGTYADIIDGIEYATSVGARVINASLGSLAQSEFLDQAIADSVAGGAVFVAAAGNEGSDNDWLPVFPASTGTDGVLAVAATDQRDRVPAFSNWGRSAVHLGAPGDEILSTVPRAAYASYSGTSMAAPHVSGAVAVLLSLQPELSPEQVSARVAESVDPIPALGCRSRSGGRLNLATLVETALGTDATPPGEVADLHVVSTGPDFAILGFTAPGDDGSAGRARAYEVRSAVGSWPGPAGAELHCGGNSPRTAGSNETLSISDLEPDTQYSVRLRVLDHGGHGSDSNIVTVTTGSADPELYAQDFEDPSTDWTGGVSGSAWAVVDCPAGRPGRCATDSPNGDYDNDEDNRFDSPPIDLTGVAHARLSFEHRYDLEAGYDFGSLVASRDGGPWETVFRVTGSSSGWTRTSVDLGSFIGSSIELSFVVQSDESITLDGWVIDDVRIDAVTPDRVDTTVFSDPLRDSPYWTTTGGWTFSGGGLATSAGASYANSQLAAASLNEPLDLSAARRAVLGFELGYELEYLYDYLLVEASTDGDLWGELARFTGPSEGTSPMHAAAVRLDAFAGQPEVWLRFVLSTDSTVTAAGATIRDFRVDVDQEPACGDGRVGPDEACDEGSANGQPGSCCAADCALLAADSPCRAARAPCDTTERCDGESPVCPADEVESAAVVCRPAAGPCDAPESCTGSSVDCPADARLPPGTLCSPASCEPGGTTVEGRCDGDGRCGPEPGTCGSVVCGPDVGDCPSGTWCAAGLCVPERGSGQSCSSADECATGHCVDEVCCDVACDGPCEACNVAESAGRCVPVSGRPAADDACIGVCREGACEQPGAGGVGGSDPVEPTAGGGGALLMAQAGADAGGVAAGHAGAQSGGEPGVARSGAGGTSSGGRPPTGTDGDTGGSASSGESRIVRRGCGCRMGASSPSMARIGWSLLAMLLFAHRRRRQRIG